MIKSPNATLIKPCTRKRNGDTVGPQEGTPSSGNGAKIRTSNQVDVPRPLREPLGITAGNNIKLTSEEDPTPGKNLRQEPCRLQTTIPAQPRQEYQDIGRDHGGASRMRARASGACTHLARRTERSPTSRKVSGVGIVTDSSRCDGEVVHSMETPPEYAPKTCTEHRSDRAQEHTIKVFLGYALPTGNFLTQSRPDGEVSY